jgi:hypothetical protein
MNFPRWKILPLALALFAGHLAAQPATNSPVDLFRQLLALSPAAQKEFLAARAPETQRRILAKLREYDSLNPTQRELKLRATELRWHLLPLLSTPATNRAAQLAPIPESVRQPVADRLRAWDKLDAAAQKELLENEATISYFTQVENGTPEEKRALLQGISPARREKLEAGIATWQLLPPPLREQRLARFNRFFELTTDEKEKSIAALTEAERQQLEKILGKFDRLSKADREAALKSFSGFTAMSVEERQQFLKNAERWRLLSPDERQAWRELVQKLPADAPPFPPGYTPPAAPMATN